MSLSGTTGTSWKVDLVEETDLAIRIFKRGLPRPDRRCSLTVAINGKERLCQDERAGPRTPANIVIDLRLDPAFGRMLILVLAGRPWLVQDMPVIAYSRANGQDPLDAEVRYLMRTPVVEQILEAIRTALDLRINDPQTTNEADPDWPLDLAAG